MKTIRNLLLVFVAFALLFLIPARQAAAVDAMDAMDSAHAAISATNGMDSSASTTKLTLAVRDGDTVWNVRATLVGLDSAGKNGPLPNVTVSFYIQRLFGLLPMRSDDNTATTDDSGHADIQMRKNIPGGTTGQLTLVARLEDDTPPIVGRASGMWGKIVPLEADPFPRTLWEPNAPISMIIVFSILFGGVWATYGFVIKQLVSIKKEKHHAV